jgi:hypothetical protein
VTRRQTRTRIIAPKTTTEAFKERNVVNNDTFDEDLVYTVLGAGVTALIFVLVIIIVLIVFIFSR